MGRQSDNQINLHLFFIYFCANHDTCFNYSCSNVTKLQDDAKVSLLKNDRMEMGESVYIPNWAGKVEGLNYQISRVESRVSELNSLHSRHLDRPGMEEEGEQ